MLERDELVTGFNDSRGNGLRKTVLVLGIGVFSLIATLLLYEITLRLFFPPPQLVDIRKFLSPADLVSTTEPKRKGTFYLEMERGRRLQPNMSVTISHHRTSGLDTVVETNSLGYRNRELGPKSAKRILFLGDSITLAEYLQDSDTFVRQVETSSGGRTEPLETINAGIGGESLQTYLYVLEETGLSIRPDVVVVGLFLNDFQPSRSIKLFHPPEFMRESWAANYLFHIFSKKYAKLTREHGQWQENLRAISETDLQEWSQRVMCCFSEMEAANGAAPEFSKLVLENISDWGGAWSEGAWGKMATTLAQMKASLDQANIPLAIVVFPVSYQVEAEPVFDFPQRKASGVAKQLGIPILDILPPLRKARSESSERLFYDQCHHTPYASGIIADSIVTFLLENGLVSRHGESNKLDFKTKQADELRQRMERAL